LIFLLFAIHLGPLAVALLTAAGFLLFGMAYEPQDVLDIRNVAIAPNKQNAFLTPVAAASYTIRPRNAGNYTAAHQPDFFTDEQMANKGHQWAAAKIRTMENTSFDATMDLEAILAGWALFFILGTETVTGAGPFVHTMKFLQATNQMPVTTLLCQETNDVIFQLPDMCILDLVISGKESGPLQVQFKMIGSGKKVDGAITFPALSAPLFLYGSDTDIKIGPSAPDLTDPRFQFTFASTVLGALTQRTVFYKLTYVNAAGETVGSQEFSFVTPANSVSKVTMPAALPPGVTGVNVYGSITTGTETKQAGGPFAAAGVFTEPATGFAAGAALPTATTALSSIKERVTDWQVHISCEMTPNRAPGGGFWATFMKVLKQRVNWTVNVKATSTDDMRTISENDTQKEIQIVTNSGAAQQMTLGSPYVLFDTFQIGQSGREQMWQMNAGDNAVLKPSTQEVFTAIVTNNQSAYGVGA
jgi:hypothetical protein